MKFIVEKEVFEKLPKACFGVVVAKGIDNSKAYPKIDWLLDESIEAATQHTEVNDMYHNRYRSIKQDSLTTDDGSVGALVYLYFLSKSHWQ